MAEDGKVAKSMLGLCDECWKPIEPGDMYHVVNKEKLHQRCVEKRIAAWRGGNGEEEAGSGGGSRPDV